MPPKTCACPHIVYTSVVGCVIGSNVEAQSVPSYTHAHALMALRHACSGLGFLWISHLEGWEYPPKLVYLHMFVHKCGVMCCWIQC
jgi:hypothetical protein